MKTFNSIMKVLAVLAAVAGTIYVIAAFGDKIVAWAKRVIGCCPWDEGMEEEKTEAPAEKTEATEEAPAAEEKTVEDNVPTANEEDFEG